jgi:uncharacterized OsmC-like protein
MAITKFSVKGKLLQNYTVLAESRTHSFVMDESPDLKGNDLGMNPVETLLSALAGCALITIKAFASSYGVEILTAEANVEGELDFRGFMGLADVRSGLQSINLKISIKSSSPEEKVKKLIELVEKRCPVDDTLSHGVAVKVSIEKV